MWLRNLVEEKSVLNKISDGKEIENDDLGPLWKESTYGTLVVRLGEELLYWNRYDDNFMIKKIPEISGTIISKEEFFDKINSTLKNIVFPKPEIIQSKENLSNLKKEHFNDMINLLEEYIDISFANEELNLSIFSYTKSNKDSSNKVFSLIHDTSGIDSIKLEYSEREDLNSIIIETSNQDGDKNKIWEVNNLDDFMKVLDIVEKEIDELVENIEREFNKKEENTKLLDLDSEMEI